MFRSGLLVLAAVTLFVDGCGGGSSQSQELTTFVAQVKLISESVRVCDARFPVDANQANTDPSTWPSAAATFKKYGACLRHIGDRLAAIHAPSAVAHAYTGYVNDWGARRTSRMGWRTISWPRIGPRSATGGAARWRGSSS